MSKYDLPTIARDVRRALMVTAFLEVETDTGFKHERVTDQMRRVMALLNELSYQAGFEGVSVKSQQAIALALSMDKGDCSRALASLLKFKVVVIEERDGGRLWIELRAARLAVAGRALEARAAMDEIELEHQAWVQQPELAGVARCLEQGRNYGLDGAISEVAAERDREAFASLATVGNVPTSSADAVGNVPTMSLGTSQQIGSRVGNVPTRPVDNRVPACAPGDSPDRQIGDSPESGAVARQGSAACGRQFRDGEKNWIFSEVQELDVKGELREETCRRTWVARIRDFPLQVREAVGEVKEEKLLGKKITSPLGRVFVKAQSMARDLGKVMRCFLAL